MTEQPTWQDLLNLVAQLNESNFESASVTFGNISVQLSNSESFLSQAPVLPVTPQSAPAVQTSAPAEVAQAMSPATAPATQPPAPATPHHGETIDAPMIGTFYRRPAPGADVFAHPGDRVEADTTIGIIEIMKLMNPIVAGKSGVLGEFLVNDAEPVEFGTPLVQIDTNA